MKKENIENLTEGFEEVKEEFFIKEPRLGEELLKDLEEKGKIKPDTEIYDVLQNRILDDSEIRYLVKEGIKRINGREKLGHDIIIGYHASPTEILSDKINVGEDGRAHFNDITGLDELYSRNGTARFVYEVRADSKIPDDKEIGINGGRFYSNGSLLILKRCTVEEFMDKHPEARFRPCF